MATLSNIIPTRFMEDNIAVSLTAILSVVVARYLWLSTQPPPSQASIPKASVIKRWLSILRSEGHEQQYLQHLKPLVDRAGIAQVRTGPIWIVYLATAERARLFFSRPDIFQKIPTSVYLPGSLMDNYFGNNIVVLNGEEWKRVRRICQPAFRRPLQMSIFASCTQELIEEWRKVDDQLIDVTSWAKRLVMDILGRTLFGYNFEAVSNPDAPYPKLQEYILSSLLSFIPATMPFLDRRWNPIRKRAWESLDQLNSLFYKLIGEKRQSVQQAIAQNTVDEKSMDLLSLMILASEKEENPLTDRELRDNTCSFFFAGHDTTSTAITAILYFLSKYPEIQNKAREEAIRVLGSDISVFPTSEQQRELVYLNAVIKETLRLVPPVPQVPTRIVAEDVDVGGGIVLQKGTFCTIDIYSIHHSEQYWPNAKQFDPERFLNDDQMPQSGSWAPFISGERACIAMNMALAEQRVALSIILRAYTWHLPENSEHQDQLQLSPGEITIPKALYLRFSPISA
ncbi:cytochrome P450 [Syncephalis plumigaleata]|nr:cytochrome P450 [Syncephalis plumigaleata]